MIYTINPANGEKLKSYNLFSKKELDKTVEDSNLAFEKWRKLKVSERVKFIDKIGKELLNNKKFYAEVITKEMGKPFNESILEVEKCASAFEYYYINAEKFLEDENVKTEYKNSYISFEPLGKVLMIMPWNFPFWQVIRCAIPALCAGNVVILKHSSVTLECSLELEKLFNKIPYKNIFQTVITDGKGVEYIMDYVQGVSLTGSAETGKLIAEKAGKKLRKVILELGGNDSFIVLKDVDIKSVCENAIKGRLLNSGQGCIAAKRFIIVKEKFEDFIQELLVNLKNIKVGDPMDDKNKVGPLATEEHRENVHRQVKNLIKEGAKLLCGGEKISGNGFYYEPTILIVDSNINFREEIFGPVFLIFKVNDEYEAVKIANNSDFGLGASIWTKDIKKGIELSKEIEAGLVFVNKLVRSDIRLPFGGVKNSGIGRELGKYGLLEFCNIKTIVVD